MEIEDTLDTTNSQAVGLNGSDMIVVLNPKMKMTREEALVQAAWLVAVADDKGQFQRILKMVCS